MQRLIAHLPGSTGRIIFNCHRFQKFNPGSSLVFNRTWLFFNACEEGPIRHETMWRSSVNQESNTVLDLCLAQKYYLEEENLDPVSVNFQNSGLSVRAVSAVFPHHPHRLLHKLQHIISAINFYSLFSALNPPDAASLSVFPTLTQL